MKQKLELKKKTISVLSENDLMLMNGGAEAAITTSFGQCTGFMCCDQQMAIAIAILMIGVLI